MTSAYSEIFMEHATSPQNVGELPDANGVGAQTNPVCGDVLKLAIKVEDGHITSARFVAKACTASVAASSALTELIMGMSVDDARNVKNTDVEEALGGLPLAKLHSGVLAAGALRRALDDYERRQAGTA